MPAPSLPAPLPPSTRRDAPDRGRLTAQPGGGHGADTQDAKPGLARGGAGFCTGLFRRGANSIALGCARTCPPPARPSPCPPPPPRRPPRRPGSSRGSRLRPGRTDAASATWGRSAPEVGASPGRAGVREAEGRAGQRAARSPLPGGGAS